MSEIKTISYDIKKIEVENFQILLKESFMKKYYQYTKKTETQILLQKQNGEWDGNEYEIDKKKFKTLYTTTFEKLKLNNILIIDNIFDFIKLIELFKSFSGSKLTEGEKYIINNVLFGKIDTKGTPTLILNYNNRQLYLKRFKCSYLSTYFNKILSKIEVF